jgi:hypothetical protein
MDYHIMLYIPISDKNNHLIISYFNIFIFIFLDSSLRGNDGRKGQKYTSSHLLSLQAEWSNPEKTSNMSAINNHHAFRHFRNIMASFYGKRISLKFRHSRAGGNPKRMFKKYENDKNMCKHIVFYHLPYMLKKRWIPACAGMTEWKIYASFENLSFDGENDRKERRNDKKRRLISSKRGNPSTTKRDS